ncbi:carboxylic ester hydrolase-like isoform X2 [Cylas formicarius]|nr:carboxylic ester hydrolase-like isoform X2 [Cylas formicarius]
MCHQLNSDSPLQDEDCLLLNVFTPNTSPDEPLPVMFYIYGGGFNSGSIWDYTPDFFMDTGNMIIVVVNYRISSFGFLSTGDDVIPGNAGLKDQLLGLKWVNKYISAFGGDPSKVTLVGQSAGAASVAFHILSPQSAGLFRGALAGSGTSLNPWAYNKDQVEMSFGTVATLNSQFRDSRNSTEILAYLQTADAKDIDAATLEYSYAIGNINNQQLQQAFFYAPVVEHHDNEPFLTDLPYESLEKGNFNKVPLLIGTSSEEGLSSLAGMEWFLSEYAKNYSTLVPEDMHIGDLVTLKEVGELIKEEYSLDATNFLAGVKFRTDQDFQKSLIKHAYLQAPHSDVFFYVFSYVGEMGGNSETLPGSGNVTHSEDLSYIWAWRNPADYPLADQIVNKRMVNIYSNFVIYQNPIPQQDSLFKVTWPTVQPDNFQYVDIDAELTVKNDYKKERYDFWDNLYKTYAVRPFDAF